MAMQQGCNDGTNYDQHGYVSVRDELNVFGGSSRIVGKGTTRTIEAGSEMGYMTKREYVVRLVSPGFRKPRMEFRRGNNG